MKRVVFLLFSFVLLTLFSCTEKSSKKELLIYCGITMVKPMIEIGKMLEESENCVVKMIKGGSGNLLKSIKFNKAGDLYLPGSKFYIDKCIKEKLVSEIVHVGYNKAAMMVQKGNPLRLKPDLNNFLKPDIFRAIADPDSGSIGREAKKIFTRKGIYEKVISKMNQLTTDSKNLITILKDKRADIVINWYATSVWEQNRDFVDVLPIDEKYAQKKKLVIGLLKFSRSKKLARKFMSLAGSSEGQKIFRRYGFLDIK